jgi:hypothetical protein
VIIAARVTHTKWCKARMLKVMNVSELRHLAVETSTAEQAPRAIRPSTYEIVRGPSCATAFTARLRHESTIWTSSVPGIPELSHALEALDG